MTKPALSLLWRTTVYAGDRDRDVALALDARPDETLLELVERVGTLHRPGDVIEIRVITADPKGAIPR